MVLHLVMGSTSVAACSCTSSVECMLAWADFILSHVSCTQCHALQIIWCAFEAIKPWLEEVHLSSKEMIEVFF
jgi:hypothetical protein